MHRNDKSYGVIVHQCGPSEHFRTWVVPKHVGIDIIYYSSNYHGIDWEWHIISVELAPHDMRCNSLRRAIVYESAS